MWRDAALVAGKDLRVEARSRVGVNQVVPFALLVLVVFAFALDSDRDTLVKVGPGLFWVTVLFSGLLAIQRSFVIESDDDARDALRLRRELEELLQCRRHRRGHARSDVDTRLHCGAASASRW